MGLRDYNDFGIPRFIWKFGFTILSDIHDDIETIITIKPLDFINSVSNFNNIKEGDIIWLKDRQLKYFIDNILPNIKVHFSLITATHIDLSVPSRCSGKIYKLFNNNLLLHWFTENFDNFVFYNYTLSLPNSLTNDSTKYHGNINDQWVYKYRDKFSGIPLGIDFHNSFTKMTSFNKRGHHNTPMQQYKIITDLLNDRDKVPLLSDRKMKIYVDYTLNIPSINKANYTKRLDYYYEKQDEFKQFLPWSRHGSRFYRRDPYRAWVYQQLTKNPNNEQLFHFSDSRLNQYDLFEERAEFVFLLSPLGNGFDCHRTWEGILFGHIIIVQSSPLDRLYLEHNLPVVIVQDWNEINSSMLNVWYNKYKELTYFENYQTRYKMTVDYWMGYMKNITMHELQNVLDTSL